MAIVCLPDSSGGSPVPEERSEFCLLRREGWLEVWVRLSKWEERAQGGLHLEES